MPSYPQTTVRLDPIVKTAAAAALAKRGLTLSHAMRLLTEYIADNGGLPQELLAMLGAQSESGTDEIGYNDQDNVCSSRSRR